MDRHGPLYRTEKPTVSHQNMSGLWDVTRRAVLIPSAGLLLLKVAGPGSAGERLGPAPREGTTGHRRRDGDGWDLGEASPAVPCSRDGTPAPELKEGEQRLR